MIEKAVCDALATVAGLTGGVYVGRAPENTAAPFAVVQVNNNGKERAGLRYDHTATVTAAIYATDKGGGRSVADECRLALEAVPRNGGGLFDLKIRPRDVSTRAASRALFLFEIVAPATYATKKNERED